MDKMEYGVPGPTKSGKNIVEFIEETNMVILNDGSRTRLTNHQDTISIPDIVISSPALAPTISFKVIQDTANSDHYPIMIE